MKKIIKLSQPNCRPCSMVQNFLVNNNIPHEDIDVTENPEVASQYGVMSTPVTILVDEEGNEIKRSIGFNPVELEEMSSLLTK